MMFYPDKNFIDQLSPGEKFVFLKIICGLVASDRQVTKEELLYLKEVGIKYESSSDTLIEMIKTTDRKSAILLARKITNRSHALVLIKDLCMVANKDTSLEDLEIEYILDIAEAMNIEPLKVREINDIVNEYLFVAKKASVILEQETQI